MKDSTIGIFILIGLLVIAFVSGGKIFTNDRDHDRNVKGTVVYDSDYVDAPLFPDNTSSKPRQSRAETLDDIENQLEEVREEIEAARASVYAGIITMNVSKPNTPDEYITLSVRGGAKTPINITGWTIRSTYTGKKLVIGTGSPLLQFSQIQPILLNKGDKAIVYSDKGSRTSFKINKCTGYFEQDRDYVPALAKKCPKLESQIFPFTPLYTEDRCIDYVQTIPRCFEPDEDDIPHNISNACENFVEQYASYEGCVNTYRNDSDFYGKEWRVYSNAGRMLWRDDREQLEVLDTAGKVVDSITY